MRDIENVFSKDEINFFLNDMTVKEYEEKIQKSEKYCLNFSIMIPSDIKNTIKEKLNCNIQDDMLPMRWIKNDTKPHVDMNLDGQEYKSAIVYLTDSEGTIHTKTESFSISHNKGFFIDLNEIHWTKGTRTPRLLVGPINVFGDEVGMIRYKRPNWLSRLKQLFIQKVYKYQDSKDGAAIKASYEKPALLKGAAMRGNIADFTNTDGCKTSKYKINIYVLIILIILFIIITLFLANSIIKDNNTMS